MPGVHAAAYAATMIRFQSVRNGSTEKFVSKPMGNHRPPVLSRQSYSSVPTFRQSTYPQPAARIRLCLYHRPEPINHWLREPARLMATDKSCPFAFAIAKMASRLPRDSWQSSAAAFAQASSLRNQLGNSFWMGRSFNL